ncbi:MAG: T-complex protein 1 subunit theta [Paramarteilia canceri]
MAGGFNVPTEQGFTSQLKPGYTSTKNQTESLLGRSVALSSIIKPSYGPLGLKIMTINKLERISVTGDCYKVFDQIEMSGPDTKIIVDALKMLFEEAGDASKFLLLLSAELIQSMNDLIRQGITKNEILSTFRIIVSQIPKMMNDLSIKKIENFMDKNTILTLVKSVIAPKLITHVDVISDLTYKACLASIYPSEDKSTPKEFPADSIRVCKIEGGSLQQSFFVPGLVMDGKPEVAVFTCGFDYNTTEASATVLFTSAKQLGDFSKGEQKYLEELVKGIADKGVKICVTSGKSSDMMLHYANKYGIMVLKVNSKWMIRRICAAFGAKPLVTMQVPNEESLGRIDSAEYFEENEQDFVTIKRENSSLSTIVLYGSTEELLSMAETAIGSGVNLLKTLIRDGRVVAGGGAFEASLAKLIRDKGNKEFNGRIKSYIYDGFASALERIPKTLIENMGTPNPGEIFAKLLSNHGEGKNKSGVYADLDGDVELVDDITKFGILDSVYAKLWAIKYACAAVDNLSRVDVIIMAKSSDFKPKQGGDWDQMENDI